MSKIMMEMLDKVKSNNSQVTIITANGYQMNGSIVKYDTDCIVFSDAKTKRIQIICFSNISTINMPVEVI